MPLGSGKVGLFGAAGASSAASWYGDRGISYAGSLSPQFNNIDYYNITSAGNGTDFGNLTASGAAGNGCSNGSRGIMPSVGSETVAIDYITVSTTGNASDFGDFTTTGERPGASNVTRGIFPGNGEDIEHITIDTTGNASDFGDRTVPAGNVAVVSNGDGDRGVIAGGRQGSPVNASVNVIDYVTISSAGDASDFGDLTAARDDFAGTASATRGVFFGGYVHPAVGTGNINTIDYVTIGSAGDATDFGDLLDSQRDHGACSNLTRGIVAGGNGNAASAADVNVIQYITIGSTGNAQDFGDLNWASRSMGALSGD